jgi:hypothetical protein
MASGRRWISLDESAFCSLNYPKRVYMPKGQRREGVSIKTFQRLNLTVAIDSSGRKWARVTTENSEEFYFRDFLHSLCNSLELEDPLWREHYIIGVDSAAYHYSVLLQQYCREREVPLVRLS